MKSKVYIETSVVGYLTSRRSRDLIVAAHQQLTQDWWQLRRADFDAYISQLVVQEAGAGDPQAAQERLQALAVIATPIIVITPEAVDLSHQLLTKGALPTKAAADALHIAVAAIHRMDYLLTWNCKHIANAEILRSIGRICRAQGYEPPVTCTPEELMGGINHAGR